MRCAKFIVLFFLLIAVDFAQAQQNVVAPSPAAARVGVAFWNIQWFPGRHPNAYPPEERRQIAAVQRDIRSIPADVIGMEEVRDFSAATTAIAPLSGFKVDAVSNFPPREGQNVGQQVAIASRLTPISAWVEMWKSAGALTPPRGFAFAAYQLAPRDLLLVYAVHLKSNRGEITEDIAIRQESMRQLRVHMNAMEHAYGKLGTLRWVIGGDFNTAPDDQRFAEETTLRMLTTNGFSWSWQGIPFSQRVTLPADKFFPAACFDHIFVRNAKLVSANVIATSPQSSDHRAVRAELELSAFP